MDRCWTYEVQTKGSNPLVATQLLVLFIFLEVKPNG